MGMGDIAFDHIIDEIKVIVPDKAFVIDKTFNGRTRLLIQGKEYGNIVVEITDNITKISIFINPAWD
jgi:hypothetical protein